MHRALLIAASAAGSLALPPAAVAQGALGALDPDRGLPPGLRARLALVDAAQDASSEEREASLVQARLDELAARWRDGPAFTAAPPLAWVDAGLAVAPFFDPAAEPEWQSGPWQLTRALPADDAQRPFSEALAAWRAAFGAEARLEVEVEGLQGAGDELTARLRLVASGASETGRLQHTATWRSRWRTAPAVPPSGPVLHALQPLEFEALTLAGHAGGLFEDVSTQVFGRTEAWREQLALGLDDWRVRLASNLDVGLLGHHGLAVGDVDGDELEDLYVCQPGGLPNRLFLNSADGTAREVAAEAGVDLLDYSSSALLVDLDEDGDVDLCVATATALCFFAGDGQGHFALKLRYERAQATSLAAADVDRDGDLDVYVCSYLSPYEKQGLPLPYHDAENGERNLYLRNDRDGGDWAFVDATAEVGLDANNRRFSFAASFEDFDGNGDPDLYVANDFGKNNLYRNNGGKFTDVARELGVEDIASSMGVAWGDVDEDGWLDLYVTNMHSSAGGRLTAAADFAAGRTTGTVTALRRHARGNTLFLNDAGRGFRDASEASGTTRGRWGWGAVLVDLDNDGRLDLFAPNGFVSGEREPDLDSFFWRQVVLRSPESAQGDATAYAEGWSAASRLARQGFSWNGHERNVALLNLGGARFADVSSVSGLDLPDDARAAAVLDWNDDGRLDLVITNRTAPMLRLLLNRGTDSNGWLRFVLHARAPRSAVGARVSVTTQSGRRLVRTLRCGEGFLAQGSALLHFGLGSEHEIRGVEVAWPDGTREAFSGAKTHATWWLVQGLGEARPDILRAAAGSDVRHDRAAPPDGAAARRTVLPTPLPLPRLALMSSAGQPASLFGITMEGPRGTGRPLLLLLFESRDEASRRALASLAEAASPSDVDVLALSAGEEPERAAARALLDELGWPHASGFTTPEALQILELVQAALHDSARAIELPLALLCDAQGRLVATYRSGFDRAQLRADRALLELSPEERRDAASPFAGRWLGPLPQPLDETVAGRLAAHGLERAAAEYRLAKVERRELSAAALSYELGVARQKQGRLADAIGHYRQALALDPTHVRAAQCLAVALHQDGELEAALAAYREALRLEPGDTLTRCNLGFLLVTRGDLAGARAELSALQNLESELAAQLAEALRRAEGQR